MDNSNIKTITAILIILNLVGVATALGVSSPYWSENPLKMHPGQTKEVDFILMQSTEESITAEVSVSLTKNEGIAEIISDTNHRVSPGSQETVKIKISVPETANFGDTYNIILSVNPTTIGSNEGNIQLGISYSAEFPVQVVEQSDANLDAPTQNNQKTTYLIIAISVALALILFWLSKRRKQV